MLRSSTTALVILVSLIGTAKAEFPTKPSHTNSVVKSKEDSPKDLKGEISATEDQKKGAAREMLFSPEESKDKESTNVLKKTKAGRLAESNKHLDK